MRKRKQPRLVCDHQILTGKRQGEKCRNEAVMIVVWSGMLTCGTHARAYLDHGLARIAYYKEGRGWQ